MKAKGVTAQDLTGDELTFLKHHNITLAEVIDVTGMIRVGQKRAMEASSARLSITGKRCNRGHRFKTRSGHCPVCDSKHLAFESRHSNTAYVYVCTSQPGLTKVGYADDPDDRLARLNREAHASRTNWKLVFAETYEKAGKVEFAAHAALAKQKADGHTYVKLDRDIESQEIFTCSAEQAIEAIRLAAKNQSGN
jgi:hypothetical protein